MDPKTSVASEPREGPPKMTAGTEYSRGIASVLIEMNGKKWGKRFVKKLGDFFANEDQVVTPIRPIAGDEEAIRIHHDTLTLFQSHIPAYLRLLGL
jgi:hypothetical protein